MAEDPFWLESRMAGIDGAAERKLRSIFVGSAGLSFLIVTYLVFLSICWRLPPLVQLLFLPMLFWSLIVTVYAVRSLWLVTRKRTLLLEDLAKRDPLTGAYSHAYLRGRLKEERIEAFESGRASAFASIRLLGLGGINKQYGHTVGNIVLRGVAKVIMDGVPADCIVGRLGGQDFAVLMPGLSVPVAHEALTTVWKRVRDYQLDLAERGRISGMDASIGLMAYPCAPDVAGDVTQLIRALAFRDPPDPGVHLAGEAQEA